MTTVGRSRQLSHREVESGLYQIADRGGGEPVLHWFCQIVVSSVSEAPPSIPKAESTAMRFAGITGHAPALRIRSAWSLALPVVLLDHTRERQLSRITCLSGHLPRERTSAGERHRPVSSCNAAPGADITFSGIASGGAHVLDCCASGR